MTILPTIRRNTPCHSLRAVLLVCLAVFSVCCAMAQGPLTITTTALPNQTAGASYSTILFASGGMPPYAGWTVFGGTFPPGWTLNAATGVLSGSSSAVGMYDFFVTVSDSGGTVSAPQGFILNIEPAPSVTPGLLPNGMIAAAYSATLTATGGISPYSNWTVVSGSLPQGLSLDPLSAGISGNPIANGYYTFSVAVQDADGVTSSPQAFSIAVGLTITTTSLPNWTLNAPYSTQLNASGGSPPYGGWTVASAALPPGLTLNATTGLLTGTPTNTGGYSFTITVADSAGTVSTGQAFTISINGPLSITSTSLPPGIVSVPYSATLTISGGTPPASWAMVNGTLPAGLSLFSSIGVISGVPKTSTPAPVSLTVQATDAAGVVATQQLSITINQASLLVSPASFSFNVNPQVPGSLAAQALSIFSNTGPVTYSAAASTSSGGNWLSVSGGGMTPGNLSVAVSNSGLAANTPYSGQITITGPTLPKAVVVPVTINVAGTLPPQLSVAPASLMLDYAQGFAVDQRFLLVTNAGTGTINFSTSVQTASCGSWLNLLNGTGAASVAGPGYVAVQVSPAGLSNQTCAGAITIGAGSQTQTIPVTMTVSALPQSILLSQTAILFEAAASIGTTPPAQTFSVLNAGSGPINWTVTAQTMSGGNWLNATPASGSSVSGSVPIPVTLSANPQGLAPGVYYGSVTLTAPGAGNSPQSVTVILTVAAQAPVQLTPTGVVLVGSTAAGVSEAETLTLTNPGANPLAYTSTVVADNHGTWLVQKPASGTVPASGVSTISLQANLQGLTPGMQHGVARVAFADGTIHTVDVYLIVPGVTSTPGCFADGFVIVFQSPEQGFRAVAQTPVPIQVIAKDCNTGNLVKRTNGLSVQALIGPQNGTAVELIDEGTGTWSGTWTPSAAVSNVNLTAMVDNFTAATGSVVAGLATVSGAVTAAPDGAAGVVSHVLNGVSTVYPSLVSPGSPVSLLGAGLSSAMPNANGPSLPTTLNGVQVLLQGQPLPLSYVDAKEVDAVIPAAVTANERQQLLIIRDNTLSAGVSVQVVNSQPVVAVK